MDETFSKLNGRHSPSLKKAEEGSKEKRPTKICRVCTARGVRTSGGLKLKTVYVCYSCPSHPGLHPDKCFDDTN